MCRNVLNYFSKYKSPSFIYSLKEAARLSNVDGRPGLYVDGNDYAEIPRFDLHNTDFTFAVWIKPKDSGKLFIGYEGSRAAFELDMDSNLRNIKAEIETSTMSSEIQLIADFDPRY